MKDPCTIALELDQELMEIHENWMNDETIEEFINDFIYVCVLEFITHDDVVGSLCHCSERNADVSVSGADEL